MEWAVIDSGRFLKWRSNFAVVDGGWFLKWQFDFVVVDGGFMCSRHCCNDEDLKWWAQICQSTIETCNLEIWWAIEFKLVGYINPFQLDNTFIGSLHVENTTNNDNEVRTKFEVPVGDSDSERIDNYASKCLDMNKKPESPVIPDDFLCLISLELMRDPVLWPQARLVNAGGFSRLTSEWKLTREERRCNCIIQLVHLSGGWHYYCPIKDATDSGNSTVDEALTILSVLASHHEAKAAFMKASTIPILIDLLQTGLPRNKENATSILLSLFKRDGENLACLSLLGAVIPLSGIAKKGIERAKRKATSLLEHLRKLQHV
ncbi:unnamed protein product [Fraxinus pennsylvanica]|uniref:RING-type E3 ubiquitin transferase n=1 Tax=Fraxinus pennsylvanica TaxID=56036 RepID=A0AAD1Z414_9LAMI|nr:unnamed protein product [Fraxinus pennsylvanica]